MHSAVSPPIDASQLPEIPGHWTERAFVIAEREFHLILPSKPDLFLDDPKVIEANRVNDYMPYWSYLWPAAPPMAAALEHAPWTIGTRLLELGSGIGLVGLAALARGDEVVFSDYDETSLALCRVNAIRNGFAPPETCLLDWRQPLDGRFPVIIGCEVTYDADQHGAILDVLDRMLAPDGLCWLGDPGRYQSPMFFRRAQERHYSVRVLDETGTEYSAPRENAFQIMELRRC